MSQNDMRQAKRQRETTQYNMYKRRLLANGRLPQDMMYWRREERRLFKTSHVTKGINFQKYDDIPVERTGGQGTESAIESFQDAADKFGLPKALADNFERCGYSSPTPVQKHSIPAALAGTDVMVSAQTGSGKTAAFLVPIITTALRAGTAELEEGPTKPRAVVLAPTRELCQQIAEEAKRLTFRTECRVVSVYGGADALPQLRALAEGCDVAICTPGRLEDFIERGVVSMEEVRYLALDEADRMLDMGFEPQIRSIIEESGMPQPACGDDAGRKTMMFSATFPKEMQDMALDFLDPGYLWIAVGRVGATASDVEQRFEDSSYQSQDAKFGKLVEVIQDVDGPDGQKAKTIVFANQKMVVDDLAWQLSDSGIRAVKIHGGLSQPQRDRSLNDLKSGRVNVLVATDVAARGLDLPGIDHVVNYELPLNGEDYVHRVGRTGRIGNTGVATSFVGAKEASLKEIVRTMKDAKKQDENASDIPMWVQRREMSTRSPSRSNYRKGGGRGGGGGGGKGYGKGRSSSPSRGRW